MKYLFAAAALLAFGGSASAWPAYDEYTRGWSKGYEAANPGARSPRPPFYHFVPRLGQSDFDRGLEDGVQRGQEDGHESAD